nr:unnamed protein product [Digitaria exilis]
MQGGRGGRPGLFGFGDPFAGFGSFGQPGSLASSFFGGVNPFDDPFFVNPFGSMMQPSFPSPFGGMMQTSFMNPFGSMMQPSLLGQGMLGPIGNLNGGMLGSQADLNQRMSNPSGFIQQPPGPSRPKGPIIKELSSDDEDDARDDEEDEKNPSGFIQQPPGSSRPKGPIIKELSCDDEDDARDDEEDDKKKVNFRKHPRESKQPYVEDPDEVEGNKRPKHGQLGREFSRASTSHPQPQTFMFQSSTVSYGGPNGACYTSSTARRTGADGMSLVCLRNHGEEMPGTICLAGIPEWAC